MEMEALAAAGTVEVWMVLIVAFVVDRQPWDIWRVLI
jgi:hypothetical protein